MVRWLGSCDGVVPLHGTWIEERLEDTTWSALAMFCWDGDTSLCRPSPPYNDSKDHKINISCIYHVDQYQISKYRIIYAWNIYFQSSRSDSQPLSDPSIQITLVLRRPFFCCGKQPLSLMALLTVRSSGLPMHGDGGGGGSSHCASPNQSPKSMVGKFELIDLPISWDNDPAIRERIRNGLNLCAAYDPKTGELVSKYVDGTPENLRVNAPVLKPIVTLMRQNDLQLPAIDKLISSVDEFFQLAKLTRSMDDCYQEAWAIRRLIGKLKRYTYRNLPPQDCFGLLPGINKQIKIKDSKNLFFFLKGNYCLGGIVNYLTFHIATQRWPQHSLESPVLLIAQDGTIQGLLEALGFSIKAALRGRVWKYITS